MKSVFDVKHGERLEPAYDIPGTRFWIGRKGMIYGVFAHEYFGHSVGEWDGASIQVLQYCKEYPKLTRLLDYEAGDAAICLHAGAQEVVESICDGVS